MNIICVEDDRNNRTVFRQMLATAGVRMAEAADAQTGIRMIEEGAFDVVLMDLRMPEMSGLTAIRRLRARSGQDGRIPIVVITADLTPGVQELCRGAGADDVLGKPVTMARLFDAIGAALKGRTDLVLN